MDLYNNEVVAYEVSERNNLKLVLDSVNKDTKKRNAHRTLLHSDQGDQYTSKKYTLLLKKHKMNVSMSRKGKCYDNACIKIAECFYRYAFLEKTQVLKAIRRYMKYYNYKRFQKKLNNLSPMDLELRLLNEKSSN
jgi:putative transposase